MTEQDLAPAAAPTSSARPSLRALTELDEEITQIWTEYGFDVRNRASTDPEPVPARELLEDSLATVGHEIAAAGRAQQDRHPEATAIGGLWQQLAPLGAEAAAQPSTEADRAVARTAALALDTIGRLATRLADRVGDPSPLNPDEDFPLATALRKVAGAAFHAAHRLRGSEPAEARGALGWVGRQIDADLGHPDWAPAVPTFTSRPFGILTDGQLLRAHGAALRQALDAEAAAAQHAQVTVPDAAELEAAIARFSPQAEVLRTWLAEPGASADGQSAAVKAFLGPEVDARQQAAAAWAAAVSAQTDGVMGFMDEVASGGRQNAAAIRAELQTRALMSPQQRIAEQRDRAAYFPPAERSATAPGTAQPTEHLATRVPQASRAADSAALR